MHTIEILAGLTFDQVLARGEKVRRRRLPRRTLQHWLSRLGIERDEWGCYSEEDALIVEALARWLRHPSHTIDQFVEKLKEIYGHAS